MKHEIPAGWKKGQPIQVERQGFHIVVEPVRPFDEPVDPDTVVLTFMYYSDFDDFMKWWLNK